MRRRRSAVGGAHGQPAHPHAGETAPLTPRRHGQHAPPSWLRRQPQPRLQAPARGAWWTAVAVPRRLQHVCRVMTTGGAALLHLGQTQTREPRGRPSCCRQQQQQP